MARTRCVVLAIGLALCASAHGSPTGSSIAINFAADEPSGAGDAFVEGAAGVAGTVNWNNTIGQADVLDEVVMDVNGSAMGSNVEVEWLSEPGTWASDGRGEDNNNAPEGNDRAMMLGYLDTTDVSFTEITVSGLPPAIAGGYDVFVYTLGGVLGRGGTYTIGNQSQENVQTSIFDGAYIEGDEGNYLKFEGLSGAGFTLEAVATTTALFRAPVNGIEICKAGECLPLPTPVAGRGNIGDQSVPSIRENEVFAPAGDPNPGLAQEWFQAANPGSKDAIDTIFDTQAPVVEAFQAGHGATWWTGNQAAFGDLVQYPDEVQPPFNDTDNSNYVTRLTGEILIPESGTYRFTDGVDDFTWLAIDADKSGVAGDDPEEVLIEDNAWTGVFREDNNGGQGLGEIDIDVAAGGEWLAIEFNQGEGGGSDAGVVYWDYDPDAAEGQRLGGQEGFPEFVEDPIFPEDAETMYIPDTHLQSSARTLISADLVGSIEGGFEFEADANSDTADTFVLDNPDDQVFTTIVDVNGLTVQMLPMGDLQDGDSFQIVDADQINGTPNIVTAGWTFNPTTGAITFGTALGGDYNGDGMVDAADADAQTNAMKTPTENLGTFDENGDGVVNYDDRLVWVHDHANTWVGDSNLDNEFNSGDFVVVFTAGKYETGDMAGWAEGDWDGNMFFDSGDFVAAFTDGGYELGPIPGIAAVPEPSAIILLAIGLLGLCRCRRSK